MLTPALLFGGSRLPLRAWPPGIPLAVLWGAPFIFFVGTGLRLTSAVLASSIAPALMPVFAGCSRGRCLRRSSSMGEICGYVLIAAGLVALVRALRFGRGPREHRGLVALVVAAAMWAAYTLRLKASGLSPLQATALICFWSAIFYVPFYFAFGLSNIVPRSLGRTAVSVGLSRPPHERCCDLRVQSRGCLLGPRAAAAIVALVPVAVTVFAIPVLDEFRHSRLTVVCGSRWA